MEVALTTAIQEKFSHVVVYPCGYIVRPRDLMEIISWLKVEQGFNFLRDITAVDWLNKRFEEEKEILPGRFDVVYQLMNLDTTQHIAIKVSIGAMDGYSAHGDSPTADDAHIPSIVSLYPTANLLEREIFDLMGIRFDGHPDLRRLLLSDDWHGHPLRKDYPVSGYDMWDWEAHH